MRKKVNISVKISTFFYSLRQGIKNIWRNKMFSLASIATMTTCIFLFSLFFSIVVNFTAIVKQAEEDVPMVVYFSESATDQQIRSLQGTIESKVGVSSIKYVSAEEAWESFQSEYFKDNPELADSFAEDNPLANSDHFEVYVDEIEQQQDIVEWIEGLDGVRSVKVSQVAASMLSNFNVLIGYVSMGIIIILLAVSIFLISNTVTIGIAVRKEEIAIMKYIGATDYFVRAPFIVEGIIIGLIGAGIPLALMYFLYQKTVEYITTRFQVLNGIITFLPVNDVFRMLLPVGLALGIGIGFFGSFFSTHRHLRV